MYRWHCDIHNISSFILCQRKYGLVERLRLLLLDGRHPKKSGTTLEPGVLRPKSVGNHMSRKSVGRHACIEMPAKVLTTES